MQVVQSNVSRRRFVGSALTLGAGATAGALVSFPRPEVAAAAGQTGQNAVHNELLRQLKAGVRGLRGARPGEAARALASTTRLLAAHYQASGLEAELKGNLEKALRRDGRDAVLRHEAGEMFDAEAR